MSTENVMWHLRNQTLEEFAKELFLYQSNNNSYLLQIKSEISSCARILEENTGPENVHVNSVINKLKELSKSHD
jgi:hypothetical protein